MTRKKTVQTKRNRASTTARAAKKRQERTMRQRLQAGIAGLPLLIIIGGVGLIGIGGYALYQNASSDTVQSNSENESVSWVDPARQLDLINLPGAEEADLLRNVTRIGDSNRFNTAIAVSQARFPNGSSQVVLVNGHKYPDAVIATSITQSVPLLYLPTDGLTGGADFDRTIVEIRRLNPSKITIVGGAGVVTEEQQAAVQRRNPNTQIRRVSGASRIETAVDLHSYFGFNGETIYLTNGFQKADSALFQAAYEEGPTLFLSEEGLHKATEEKIAITRNNRKLVLLGGENTISADTEREIREKFPNKEVERLSAANRFATAVQISKKRYPTSAETVFIVNAEAEADAVIASTYAAGTRGPVLYTDQNRIPQETIDEIARLNPTNIVIIGDTARVGESVAQFLGGIANHYIRSDGRASSEPRGNTTDAADACEEQGLTPRRDVVTNEFVCE